MGNYFQFMYNFETTGGIQEDLGSIQQDPVQGSTSVSDFQEFRTGQNRLLLVNLEKVGFWVLGSRGARVSR